MKRILGLIFIIVAGLSYFLTDWSWWIALIILVVGIIMLFCRCDKCRMKKVETPQEESQSEAPITDTVKEEVSSTPEVSEEPKIMEDFKEEEKVVSENKESSNPVEPVDSALDDTEEVSDENQV